MRYGVSMFVTDRSIGVVELAKAAEERGLDSLFLPEHTHIPTSRKTPYPAGGPLPDEYRRTVDPFVALAAAAAVTTRISLGTGICLVAQRHPIHTAKEVATIDLLAPGRFVLGVGIGWNQDEAEDHGVDFKRRRSMAREHILAMRRLWSDDEASFQGEFVKLPPSWAWPKPAKAPPIVFGGAPSPALFQHVAEYADGWMPIGGSGLDASIPALRRAFEAAGRPPETARVIVLGPAIDEPKTRRLRDRGADEAVFFLPSTSDRDLVLLALDRCAEIARVTRAG